MLNPCLLAPRPLLTGQVDGPILEQWKSPYTCPIMHAPYPPWPPINQVIFPMRLTITNSNMPQLTKQENMVTEVREKANLSKMGVAETVSARMGMATKSHQPRPL